MKTQINNLVKGDHRLAISGTNSKLRNSIAEKVIAENPKSITVELRGYTLILAANWSKSGKSVSYFGSMPIELYVSMFGNFCLPRENARAFVRINGDMSVWALTNSRKNAFQIVAEKEITIK
jgi:hypothetical protein